MHQKPFVGQTSLGPTGEFVALPRRPIWILVGTPGTGKATKGTEEGKGGERGKDSQYCELNHSTEKLYSMCV